MDEEYDWMNVFVNERYHNNLEKIMTNAIEMKQRIKIDWKLRQIYTDYDFDKIIRKCKVELGYETNKVNVYSNNEISGFYVIPDGMELPLDI